MDQDEPGFAGKFAPPMSGSDGDLLTTTDAILGKLEVDEDNDNAATKAAKAALVAKFVTKELPADFVTHLREDRDGIENAEDEIEADEGEGVSSTAAIGRLIREGMSEIKYLNAIMYNKYSRNPDKLRAWLSASHIERAPQREKTPPPAPQPPK